MKTPPTVALSLDSSAPIDRKVRVLETFLGEHYFAESGIMYSMWRYDADAGVARPWVEADLDGQIFHQGIPCSNTEWLHGENSPFTSGLFLASQALRYRVTGDEQALAFARRAFGSLDKIARLSEAVGEPGWLCKPYGWRYSHETSPDQYMAAVYGLWQFRPIATAAERARVDDLLVSWADRWRKQGCKLVYFGTEYDFFNSTAHWAVFPCFQEMAFAVTGDARYRAESQRLIDRMNGYARDRSLSGWLTQMDMMKPSPWFPAEFPVEDETRRPFLMYDTEHRGATWLIAMALDLMASQRSDLAEAVAEYLPRAMNYAALGLREDRLHHYAIAIDMERMTWQPLAADWPGKTPKFSWEMHSSSMCWGDAAGRLPHMAAITQRHAPTATWAGGELRTGGPMALARRMWQALDNRRLQWMIDPDGKQIPDEVRYAKQTLSSEVHANTSLSYWHARANGLV